jgi:phage tail-like protein
VTAPSTNGHGASTASGSAPSSVPSYGLVMRFTVVVDSQKSLGSWSSCSGLSVSFEHEAFKEGGNSEYARFLPKNVSYEKITLERAMDKTHSASVQQWLQDVIKKWILSDDDGRQYEGSTVVITLYDSRNSKVASWTLRNAIPTSWSGPSLSGKGNDVAVEKLQLIHAGFL